jgi:hypothetical protein
MRERAEAAGGELEAGPGADRFIVTATLPRQVAPAPGNLPTGTPA